MNRLYNAVEAEDILEVQRCIEEGLDVNKPVLTQNGDEDYPLNLAASRGLTAIASVLLEHGAWVDMIDELNHTPIQYAEEYGNEELRDLLLKKSSQKRPMKKTIAPSSTAFLSAVRNGNVSKVLKLYNEVSQNKAVMTEASHDLIDRIYKSNKQAYMSKWKALTALFANNPFYLNCIFLEQYVCTINPKYPRIKKGRITTLYLNHLFDTDFMDSLLNIVSLDQYPACIVEDKSLNILQMAIIFYSGPECLPFIQQLLEKYQMSTRFKEIPRSKLEVYRKEDVASLLYNTHDNTAVDTLTELSKIDNALDLALKEKIDQPELIEFLIAHISNDMELIVSAARMLSQTTFNTRVVPISSVESKSTVFLKEDQMVSQIEKMMEEFPLPMQSIPDHLSGRIISAIQYVEKSTRPSIPAKTTCLFCIDSSLGTNQFARNHFRAAQLLLKTIDERISPLPKETLTNYLTTLLNKAKEQEDPKMALPYYLATQLVYAMIKKPSLYDFEGMLQCCLFKAQATNIILNKKNMPNERAEYLSAGTVLLCMFAYQLEHQEIQNFIQKSNIYKMLMDKLQALEAQRTQSLFSNPPRISNENESIQSTSSITRGALK